jgi:hypothetical protein
MPDPAPVTSAALPRITFIDSRPAQRCRSETESNHAKAPTKFGRGSRMFLISAGKRDALDAPRC